MRTYRRWQSGGEDGRPIAERAAPSHTLSEAERDAIVAVCNESRFASLPPSQIVPRLADEGRYLASESSFYRVLHAAGLQHHRGRAREGKRREPTTHEATGPNQVWCWDVSYLPSGVRGLYFYLYLVLDLYSRKIVGWEVHDSDDSAHASPRHGQRRDCRTPGYAPRGREPVAQALLHGSIGRPGRTSPPRSPQSRHPRR